MGRRIREHVIKIAYWQENQLIQEEYTAPNLYEALDIARNFEKNSAVNIYDVLDRKRGKSKDDANSLIDECIRQFEKLNLNDILH